MILERPRFANCFVLNLCLGAGDAPAPRLLPLFALPTPMVEAAHRYVAVMPEAAPVATSVALTVADPFIVAV